MQLIVAYLLVLLDDRFLDYGGRWSNWVKVPTSSGVSVENRVLFFVFPVPIGQIIVADVVVGNDGGRFKKTVDLWLHLQRFALTQVATTVYFICFVSFLFWAGIKPRQKIVLFLFYNKIKKNEWNNYVEYWIMWKYYLNLLINVVVIF